MHVAIGWPLDDPAKCVHFQLDRTESCQVRAVLDPSGIDTLFQEVTLDVESVWNPHAFASGKGAAGAGLTPSAAYNVGVPGDRWAVTWQNLRETLFTPRQRVTVFAGDDVLFQAPLTNPNPPGGVLPCCPVGGPFIDRIQIVPCGETRTAFVSCRIRFGWGDRRTFVLSNRWTARAAIDCHTMLTRRVIEGRVKFRLDFLHLLTPRILADQFRAAIAVPQGKGAMRAAVNVVASERGDELMYLVEDQEQDLNLGAASAALSVEWNATSGAETPEKELSGLSGVVTRAAGDEGAAGKIARGLVSPLLLFAPAGPGGAGGISRVIAGASLGIPVGKNQATCRVLGRPGAPIWSLVRIGLNVCLDRLTGSTADPAPSSGWMPVSLYVTQFGQSGPAGAQPAGVEVRLEMLRLRPDVYRLMVGDLVSVAAIMNMNEKVVGSLKLDPAYGNPPLPCSGGMRGTMLAYLASQILNRPGVPPSAYPDDPAAMAREYVSTF